MNISLIRKQNVCHLFCNTIKHIITDDIPSYAIERVLIYKNDTIITDDMLNLRLALIPIKLDPRDKTLPREVIFTFEAVYKKETDGYVYSDDIICQNVEGSDIILKGIPISKLIRDQEIKLKAVATISTGYEHSKWSLVCAPSFWKEDSDYVIKIETNGVKTPEEIYNEGIDILKDQLALIMYKDLN